MAGSYQGPNRHDGSAPDWTCAPTDWQHDTQSAKRRRLDDTSGAYSWQPAVYQYSQTSSLRLPPLQLPDPRPGSFATCQHHQVQPQPYHSSHHSLTPAPNQFSFESSTNAWSHEVYSLTPLPGPATLHLEPLGAQQGQRRQTSHNTSFLPSTSTSLDNLFATANRGQPEQNAESQHRTQSRFSSEEQDQPQADPVCFGRIQSIRGKCDRGMSAGATTPFAVQIVSSDRFVGKDVGESSGKIATEHGQVIQGLLDESSLQLFATCTLIDAEPPGRSTKPARIPSQMSYPCTLDITIYGPLDILEEIGTWFQDHDLYLQDPLQCHLDTKYCNPHKLSAEDISLCPTVSDIVRQSSGSLLLQDVLERPDLLDILSNGGELEETEQPAVIRASLKRHQKQALTFMLRRERGWDLRENQSDMWEYLDADHGGYYLNRVSGAHQVEEPPPFRGGIIADPMGLGKTLTMIALVGTDLEQSSSEDTGLDFCEEDKPCVAATLIIIPPPLIGTWEHELTEHVIPDGLEFRRHHGKSRLSDIRELDGVNLALTTYHTVSAEWKPSGLQSTSVLFSVRWRRIILDEAHFIRNFNSRMARAACELESVSRWAVTGTPIQNRLSDLAAQLKFIRAHPYDDVKQFEADVSRLWKAGDDEEAVKRLKRLSACLLLRRAKATINLPVRRDMTCAVDFSREERAAYDEMKQQTITKIDEALRTDSDASRAGVYVNVLQQIESLRLACNLGLHYHKRHDHETQNVSAAEEWAAAAQRAFNVQREMGPIVCLQCSSTTELTETLLDDTPDARLQAQLFRCLRFACGDCVKKLQRTKHPLRCGHKPSCPIAPVSISHTVMEEVTAEGPDPDSAAPPALPSKVQALVSDIKAVPTDVKSVVFSTWRLTLDVVERGLRDAGIRSIRFDGSVPQKDRQSVVDSFKADPGIRVMLLTLSCGAVGLTLTEASRAYLMEPHWNPTLEEQALARIHRIGQTREVTTVRLYIRDSFEEQVMELQNAKRQLAGVLLSPHDGSQGDDSLGGLHKLRSLL